MYNYQTLAIVYNYQTLAIVHILPRNRKFNGEFCCEHCDTYTDEKYFEWLNSKVI